MKFTKLTIVCSFSRSNEGQFEHFLSGIVSGFSRVDQLGFYKSLGKKSSVTEKSYQYILYIESEDFNSISDKIINWFSKFTNEECVIFETLSRSEGFGIGWVTFDRLRFRKALDSILADPSTLLREPVPFKPYTDYRGNPWNMTH